MTGMASTGRCTERDAGGRRCILDGGHRSDRHVPASADYHLGMLQQAVKMYLAGAVDREFLASVLAEVEAEAS